MSFYKCRKANPLSSASLEIKHSLDSISLLIWPTNSFYLYFLCYSSSVWNWRISRSSRTQPKLLQQLQPRLRERFRRRWRKPWRSWLTKTFRTNCWWLMPNSEVPLRISYRCNVSTTLEFKSWCDAFDHNRNHCSLVFRRKRWPPWLSVLLTVSVATSSSSRLIRSIRWLFKLNACWTIWTKNSTTTWWEQENGELTTFWFLIYPHSNDDRTSLSDPF